MMTVKEVFDLRNSYSGLTTIAVVVLASLLEVSKIKINAIKIFQYTEKSSKFLINSIIYEFFPKENM